MNVKGLGLGTAIMSNPYALLIIAIIGIIMAVSGILVAIYMPGILIGIALWVFAFLVMKYAPIKILWAKWVIIIALVIAGVYIFANPHSVEFMVVS